ncbi:hypothetical protein [Streptomyces sp. NBC_00859]|uniref:hypothetical protein n=1 Tax=Streptomyces sp. NBC_00859 TaxID=2903682 RepID=UPI00386788F0|nr:hypothetical protein OG584_18600 [Streptomyces sp. NBC_00859]
MKKPRRTQPEPTPAELALQVSPEDFRSGYMPHDGIPEPAQGPSEPAAASAAPSTPVRETPEAAADE